jgi:hypothetical protein
VPIEAVETGGVAVPCHRFGCTLCAAEEGATDDAVAEDEPAEAPAAEDGAAGAAEDEPAEGLAAEDGAAGATEDEPAEGLAAEDGAAEDPAADDGAAAGGAAPWLAASASCVPSAAAINITNIPGAMASSNYL